MAALGDNSFPGRESTGIPRYRKSPNDYARRPHSELPELVFGFLIGWSISEFVAYFRPLPKMDSRFDHVFASQVFA